MQYFCQFNYPIAKSTIDSLNGTALAVLAHLSLVVKVDQLDIIERPNIESHRFKTIVCGKSALVICKFGFTMKSDPTKP